MDLSKINKILETSNVLIEEKDGVQWISPTIKKIILELLEEISLRKKCRRS